ncbi:3-hydroxybutyrate dehydrogenase [Actinomadura rubrobrunea]|uniref:3-hydroxybutyrate dehydrogenase n=1 Tax=Actinomadura rubrobrunea TaxID=115335 RepID=A0A9W6UY17_9ACTN|nr:3-hydroxybutyrate dehydrogenase [Actinomadura rubrobrunea]GLW66723.1 3-hydroxybutyrate dehydrogenase [Actinomadura rubrobrunea]
MTSVHSQTAAPADLDLSGRRALVTGGAGGIGLACAERLAAAGARVTIVDVRGGPAREAAERLGGTARVADLADPGQLDALARDCDVDIIVNNAGIQHVAPLQEFPPETFTAIMRIMVEAPFRLVRAALPGMYERGWGRVVNISSVHGLRASPYKAAYVAAKHALEGLSKVIALEGAPHGVTSNCVCPAYVRTPLVEGQIADQARVHGLSPEAVTTEVMLARTAIKRLIEPAEVAETVAFLCAPRAAMITGASITLDGGWTAH